MASYSVVWKRSARKELRKLPHHAVSRVVSAVGQLATAPRPSGTRKLAGSSGSYRFRIGDYRVVYSIFDKELVIEILRVGHRKDVYR